MIYAYVYYYDRSTSEQSEWIDSLYDKRRNSTCDWRYHCEWNGSISFSLFILCIWSISHSFIHFIVNCLVVLYFFLLKTKLLLIIHIIWFILYRKLHWCYLQLLLMSMDWMWSVEKKWHGIWLGIFWEWLWYESF